LLATAGVQVFAQNEGNNLPQKPHDGITWNAADATPDTLPGPRHVPNDFDYKSPSPLDATGPFAIDPDSVTITSLTADALWEAADRTSNHTAPGIKTALNNLATAVMRFDTSPTARAEVLVRIAEVHLRILGDSNTAELLALGGQTVGRNSLNDSLAYIRGMAQDMRKAGAVNAATYLENSASNAMSENPQKRTELVRAAVLDAATLALRYGATPHPNLADILSYDPETVPPETVRDLTIHVLKRLGETTRDSGYTETAELLAKGATPDGIRHIRARILEMRDPLER
jgi:hypothetical protein